MRADAVMHATASGPAWPLATTARGWSAAGRLKSPLVASLSRRSLLHRMPTWCRSRGATTRGSCRPQWRQRIARTPPTTQVISNTEVRPSGAASFAVDKIEALALSDPRLAHTAFGRPEKRARRNSSTLCQPSRSRAWRSWWGLYKRLDGLHPLGRCPTQSDPGQPTDGDRGLDIPVLQRWFRLPRTG